MRAMTINRIRMPRIKTINSGLKLAVVTTGFTTEIEKVRTR